MELPCQSGEAKSAGVSGGAPRAAGCGFAFLGIDSSKNEPAGVQKNVLAYKKKVDYLPDAGSR